MNPPTTGARAPWGQGLKAREYTAEEWQQHFETFKKLYFIEDRGLQEVRQIMAEKHNFYATEVQYKKKITKWKLEKNIKEKDMLLMLNKRQKRKLKEDKETEFSHKGRPVNEEKLDRFEKRCKRPITVSTPEQADTPSWISYSTPRHSGPGTPAHLGSVNTPTPMDIGTPRVGTSGFNLEQPTHYGGVNAPSPVATGPSAQEDVLHLRDSYQYSSDHWRRATGNPEANTGLNPPSSVAFGTNDHEVYNDIGDYPSPSGTRRQEISPYVGEKQVGDQQSNAEVEEVNFYDANDGDALDTWREEDNEWDGIKAYFQGARRGFDLGDFERYLLQDLVIHLGHDLLALKLAGAYITATNTTIAQYLSMYNDSVRSLIDRIPRVTNTSATSPEVAAFEVSFGVVQRKFPKIADLLLTCAYLHHEEVPDDLISRGISQGELEAQDAIDKLLLYSLVERTLPRDGFSINPLLHSWLRERQDLSTRRKVVDDALQLLGRSIPSGGFEKAGYWILERQILRHIDECWKYARMYYALDTGDIGVQVLATGKVFGEVHPDNLEAVDVLRAVYTRHGRWQEAEELGKQVVATRKRVLGEAHPDTLTSMNILALTYARQGRLEEAEKLGKQVLATSKRVLGEAHPDTLASMSNLALTYQEQGQLDEAEELGKQELAMSKRVLGEAHPDTLTSMNILASTYQKQGRLEEAEELGKQELAMSKRVLGEAHPDTLASMNILASTYQKQGRLEEAEELGKQVLATRKRVLGEAHPDTLISMGNLASTYQEQGRLEEAEELGKQVLATRKRVLGEAHPDTLTSMNNLASTYEEQGRLEEAEELGKQVLATRKRVLGEAHPDTLASMNNLASTYEEQGRLEEAEELGKQELAMSKRVLGEAHPDTLASMGNLASTYQKQGRFGEAAELRKRVLGETHPDTLTTVGKTSSTYKRQVQ